MAVISQTGLNKQYSTICGGVNTFFSQTGDSNCISVTCNLNTYSVYQVGIQKMNGSRWKKNNRAWWVTKVFTNHGSMTEPNDLELELP